MTRKSSTTSARPAAAPKSKRLGLNRKTLKDLAPGGSGPVGAKAIRKGKQLLTESC